MYLFVCFHYFFFFKQKTAYEMRISDWSSDVCSSDLLARRRDGCGVLRLQRQREIRRVRRHHLADRHAAQDREVPRLAESLLRQRHLRRVARPETAVQTSLLHARQVGQIGRASWRERVCQYV